MQPHRVFIFCCNVLSHGSNMVLGSVWSPLSLLTWCSCCLQWQGGRNHWKQPFRLDCSLLFGATWVLCAQCFICWIPLCTVTLGIEASMPDNVTWISFSKTQQLQENTTKSDTTRLQNWASFSVLRFYCQSRTVHCLHTNKKFIRVKSSELNQIGLNQVVFGKIWLLRWKVLPSRSVVLFNAELLL